MGFSDGVQGERGRGVRKSLFQVDIFTAVVPVFLVVFLSHLGGLWLSNSAKVDSLFKVRALFSIDAFSSVSH